jgi:hypothetical protein
MSRIHSLFLASAAVGLVLGDASTPLAAQTMSIASAASKRAVKPAVARLYGSAVKVGDGNARSYVLFDEKTGAPREIGVALSEQALENLPAAGSGHHGAGAMTHEFILSLPEGNKTPFQFVEMNWNPMGHEPDGVYQDVPHFDFHFYTISKAERDAIVPTNPDFAKKANNVPAKEYVPPFNVPLGPPGASPAQVAVPMMGVHWLDVRSPELQNLLGKPDAYQPFTATFIHGSWDGRFHFWEPMITRAHILVKKTTNDAAVRDQVLPLPLPAKYQTPGYYPAAYRITWDADAREYRIALTELDWRK